MKSLFSYLIYIKKVIQISRICYEVAEE